MKCVRGIGLGIGLVIGALGAVDVAGAQGLTDAVMSNAIQVGRMTVLQVEKDAGRIYCLEADGRLRLVEFDKDALPQVVADGTARHDLGLLNAGDIIKVERHDGRPQRIIVLRRAWEEAASPEF